MQGCGWAMFHGLGGGGSFVQGQVSAAAHGEDGMMTMSGAGPWAWSERVERRRDDSQRGV